MIVLLCSNVPKLAMIKPIRLDLLATDHIHLSLLTNDMRRDPNLTDIVANVTMFDFKKENVLSNSIAKELSLQKPVDESGPS